MEKRSRRTSKRRAVFVTVILACILAISGCTENNQNAKSTSSGRVKEGDPGVFAADSTMANIQNRGKLIVGINFNAAPFAYNNSATGSHAGLDVALVRHIATGIFGTRIENKIEYVEYNEDELDLALRNNNIDIAVGRYAITPARKQFIAFAGPHFVSRQSALIRSGTSTSSTERISSFIDLNGRKVCVVRGSTDLEMIRQEIPRADVQPAKSTVGECAAALANSEVDAIISENVDQVRTLSMAENQIKEITTDSNNLGAKAYGVGVKLEANDLRQYINDRIENWKDYDKVVQTEIGSLRNQRMVKPQVDRY